jgi:uncharacterized protein YbbK (DUF523 family)
VITGSQEEGGARPALVVSACLLGAACTHRGGAKVSPAVAALSATHRLIPVCPEVAGGLPTPRPPAERGVDGSVRCRDGSDVTGAYRRGADHAVAVAVAAGAAGAVLKARSPSCGAHAVYDGTFSGTLRPGAGVTAEALRAARFAVWSEEDVESGDFPGRSMAAPGA